MVLVDYDQIRQTALQMGAVPIAIVEQVKEVELVKGRMRWNLIGGTQGEEVLIGMVCFGLSLCSSNLLPRFPTTM